MLEFDSLPCCMYNYANEMDNSLEKKKKKKKKTCANANIYGTGFMQIQKYNAVLTTAATECHDYLDCLSSLCMHEQPLGRRQSDCYIFTCPHSCSTPHLHTATHCLFVWPPLIASAHNNRSESTSMHHMPAVHYSF